MRIGTRGSALALAQARLVAQLLGGAELVTITTAGDRNAAGDKSRWVQQLERALSAREIDLAVHSAKDVPGELPDGLSLLGAPARAAPEDVLCGASGLKQLEPGARVGTSSLRRAAQLRAARGDLEVVAVGGNVDTRLRKLHEGEAPDTSGAANGAGNQTARGGSRDAAADKGGLDALVLARAGLQRLGRESEIAAILDPTRFVPSPGQGTLALEGRAGDERTREAVEAITDAKAFACLRAERAVAQALGASCNTPLGAHALDAGCGCLHLRAWVGLPDGSAWVSDELVGGFYDPEQLGGRMAERLLSAGAGELLRHAEERAVEHA
ncbi:MAG: hydroxymethylbilane synthase [Solirubrobacterales bacterium]